MQNTQYLLMCRSLTYAQRSARILERAGVTGTVSRIPRAAADRGCGYCVVVSARQKDRALAVLADAGLCPERVMMKKADGTLGEVAYDIS